MSVELMGWAWKQEIPPFDKIVLLAICDGSTHRTRIYQKTGISGDSLESILCFLVNEGLISESTLGCIQPGIGE